MKAVFGHQNVKAGLNKLVKSCSSMTFGFVTKFIKANAWFWLLRLCPAESSADSWGGIWVLHLHTVKWSWLQFVWGMRDKPLWRVSRHAVFTFGLGK